MKREFFIAAAFCVLCYVAREARCQTSGDSAAGLRDPFENQLPEKEILPAPEPEVIVENEPPPPPIIAEEPVIPPALTVESLVTGGPVPQAIIGGKIFRVGNAVEEARITKIVKDGVEIIYKEKTFWLPAPSSRLREKVPSFTDKEENKEGTNAP